MKRYNGAEAKKMTSREQLPVGGYQVKIINAKEEQFDWGNRLAIAFDIASRSAWMSFNASRTVRISTS